MPRNRDENGACLLREFIGKNCVVPKVLRSATEAVANSYRTATEALPNTLRRNSEGFASTLRRATGGIANQSRPSLEAVPKHSPTLLYW